MGHNIRVGIAEDHVALRKALLSYVGQETNIEFVIEAGDGLDLLSQLRTKRVDVIIMDIRMPEMDGFQTSVEVLKKYPAVRIICFTQYDDLKYIIEMMKIGVKSFITKDQIADIPKAIQLVYDGGVYYPDKISSKINEYIKNVSEPVRCPFELSSVELTHLRLICNGLSSTEIGNVLNKSSRTVEKYRNDLYEKFGVINKEQLIVKTIRLSLIN